MCTTDVDGLTALDFKMAAEIDTIANMLMLKSSLDESSQNKRLTFKDFVK